MYCHGAGHKKLGPILEQKNTPNSNYLMLQIENRFQRLVLCNKKKARYFFEHINFDLPK